MTSATTTTATTDTNAHKDLITNSVTEFENYDSCKMWLEGYNSPATEDAYKNRLTLFCRYHNVNPDSLVQLKPEQIKNTVLNYIVHLKKVTVFFRLKVKSTAPGWQIKLLI